MRIVMIVLLTLVSAGIARAASVESKYGTTPAPTPEVAAPETAADHFAVAVEAFRKGDSRNAEQSVRNALSLDPKNPDYHYLLGKIYLFRAAEKNRLEIRNDGTDSPETKYVKRYVKGREELELAKSSFEVVTKLQAQAADAWLNLGTCEDNLGNEDAAVVAFEQAIRLAPATMTARDANNNLGLLQRSENRPELAYAAFQAALAIDPTFLPARVNVQRLLEKYPKLKKAAKPK
ncbi:MAG: tetratricopeptide repeat protein [Deltaproteobacteria bacterium]|nr:tetratricopeptide repeat protein [Deltaproteobacteria bacterium]